MSRPQPTPGRLAGPVLWVLVYVGLAALAAVWLTGSVWPAVGPAVAVVVFSCTVGLLTRD